MHLTSNILAAVIGSLSLASAATLSGQQSLISNGIQRTFYFYKPDNFNPAAGLVIYLHGGGGNGAASANGGTDFLWQKLADRVGVLALFPEGRPYTTEPTKKTWNDCSDDTRGTDCVSCTNWDDVQFMRDLTAWAGNTFQSLNLTRVYSAGKSVGSMMAQRLALEAPDLVAAVASIAGNLPVSNDNTASGAFKCKGYDAPYDSPATAVPILLFKGDADPKIPFGATAIGQSDHNIYALVSDWCHRPKYGNNCPPTPDATCVNGCVHSFYDTLAFWQWKHGLTSNRQRRIKGTQVVKYADSVTDCTDSCSTCDGSTVIRHDYGQIPYPVAFDRAAGAGHHFPGPSPDTSDCKIESDLGWKNRDALSSPGGNPYIAEEMWAFFDQFSKVRS